MLTSIISVTAANAYYVMSQSSEMYSFFLTDDRGKAPIVLGAMIFGPRQKTASSNPLLQKVLI
jgi:hypothetical protein